MSDNVWVVTYCSSNNSANPSDHTEQISAIFSNETLAKQKVKEWNNERGFTEKDVYYGDGYFYDEWEVEDE